MAPPLSGPISAPISASRAPIWLLVGEKLGDNAQVRTIATALELPVEEKLVRMREAFRFGKPQVKPSLHHIDPEGSAPLEPPWPDLVITIGRRLSMVALWIKAQSGGRTRIVLVGRPRRLLDRFDLVVTAAHYRLPPRKNVLRLDLPLMRVDEAAVRQAAQNWAPRFAGLRRPLIALMVGGPTKPVRFDVDVAQDLIARAAAQVAALGGSLYVTTSRRTPAAIVEALAAGLPEGAVLHRWRADAEDNPYLALLGSADAVIVTGDSISMMVEAARLGKPLAIYQQPPSDRLTQRCLRWLGGLAERVGLAGSRDLSALHELMFARGLAVPLGQPFPESGRRAADELPKVAARVRALLEPR